MLSQGPIPPDDRLQCFHRARYHQMTDCNAFTGPDTTRCQTAMLSQVPIPPDAPDVTQYHQMPDCNAFTVPDTTRYQQCFALYHQMPPVFTGPDTTRCQTAMRSQVPIPPDATRCNPIPPDARLQCFHRARYHQMPDGNAFTGPHTTRCHQM